MADPLSIETWRGMFQKHGQKFGWGLAVVFGVPLVVGFGWSQYSGRGNNGPDPMAQQNAVIMTVNGQPITQLSYLQAAQSARGAEPGDAYARAQGEVMNKLVTFALLEQEAKKRNVRASDADIDSEIAKERDGASKAEGHTLTDAEWEDKLQQARGISAAEYREEVARQLVGLALMNSLKSAEKVTDEDVRHQNDEVKLTLVQIPTISASTLMPNKDKKQLPDPQAKQKAEDLLAKAKAGADLAAIARANSGDFSSKQGGDLGWRPEYRTQSGMPMAIGALGFGKDFDEAVHKTQKGQFTDVVKSIGFSPGYVFARVTDRRNTPPKDFDAKKAADLLRDERAKQKLNDMIIADLKTVKVDVKDPDKKAYYDYYKAQQMQQQQMMAQFGQPSDGPVPTASDVAKQQAAVDADFQALLKQHPDDATAAMMVAATLKKDRFSKPGQQDQIRDRLISLYETALKTTENRDIRLELADLYRDKKQNDKADTNYAMIARLMSYNPPQDETSMQTELGVHQQLQGRFTSINKPDEAAKEQASISQLQAQIAQEKQKTAAQAAAAKMPGIGGGISSVSGATPGGQPLKISIPPTASKGAPAVPATAPGTKTK